MIIVCAAAWVIAAAACLFGRSRMIQRVGCMELILVAAVGGSALFGYLKAADFTKGQYYQMLAISLGSAVPYLADLEDELEVYGGSDTAFLREAERVVEDALPILAAGETSRIFNSVFLVKKDEDGVYRECFSRKETGISWERLKEMAVPLIGRARRSGGTVWQAYDGETTVFAVADPSRITPAYALVVPISDEPLTAALSVLKKQYFYYSLLFMTAATFLVALAVLIQEKEMHRILRLLARAAKGREETPFLLKLAGKSIIRRQSNETRALHSSLNQIAINTERRNYGRYQMIQAYHRFAPKEIEKILGRKSILDVAAMDQVETESTLAFVSFAGEKGISDREYLQQMNRNHALLFAGCREFGGSLIADGTDPGTLRFLFHDKSRQALRFGMQTAVRFTLDQTAGQVFVLLHRAQFVFGVAGDEEQSFSYIYSREVRILQKHMDNLQAMGVRMAVTDRVWEAEKEEAPARYIGYIEEEEYRFDLYEILDVYPAEERYRRLAHRARFQQALDLYYKRDFYLARSMFSDVIKSCPEDEVAKWYLFLCEDGLNAERTRQYSFGLFSER